MYRDIAEDDLARDHATLTRESGERDDLDELPDRPRSLKAEAREARQAFTPDERLAATEILDLSLEAVVPHPDLSWRFHVRPEARVGLRSGFTPRARVGLRAVLEISMGPPAARKHVVDVIARVRYDLVQRSGVATLQVRLIAW